MVGLAFSVLLIFVMINVIIISKNIAKIANVLESQYNKKIKEENKKEKE